MTDNFLQKFEEKVMTLLSELETLRKELGQLRQENSTLKADKSNYTKKLQTLISLFDSLNTTSADTHNQSELQVMSGLEDYSTA